MRVRSFTMMSFFAASSFLSIKSYAGDERYWVEVQASSRDERTVISQAGVAIEQVNGEKIGGFAAQSDIERLLKLSLPILMQKPLNYVDGVGIAAFPEKDRAFHDYSEVESDLKLLAKNNPDLVSVFSIGKSIQKRDLYAVRFNSTAKVNESSEKPGIVFMGTHHAREHLSTEIPLMLAQWLVANKDREDIKKLLATRDIYILPLINPDGAEHDHSGGRYKYHRKNMRENAGGALGVDLNRNYGFHWNTGGSSSDPKSEVYHGPAAFSEPETQAVKAFIEAHTNLKVLLSFHTFSELILYPWGHTDDPIADARASRAYVGMAKKMAEWNGYTPQQSSELYISSGDTTDWAWGERGIFSFTFELTPSTQWAGGFYPGAEVIQATFDANLEPALYLIGMTDDPYRAGELSIGLPEGGE